MDGWMVHACAYAFEVFFFSSPHLAAVEEAVRGDGQRQEEVLVQHGCPLGCGCFEKRGGRDESRLGGVCHRQRQLAISTDTTTRHHHTNCTTHPNPPARPNTRETRTTPHQTPRSQHRHHHTNGKKPPTRPPQPHDLSIDINTQPAARRHAPRSLVSAARRWRNAWTACFRTCTASTAW